MRGVTTPFFVHWLSQFHTPTKCKSHNPAAPALPWLRRKKMMREVMMTCIAIGQFDATLVQHVDAVRYPQFDAGTGQPINRHAPSWTAGLDAHTIANMRTGLMMYLLKSTGLPTHQWSDCVETNQTTADALLCSRDRFHRERNSPEAKTRLKLSGMPFWSVMWDLLVLEGASNFVSGCFSRKRLGGSLHRMRMMPRLVGEPTYIRAILTCSCLPRCWLLPLYNLTMTLKVSFARVVHPDQFGGMEGKAGKQIADPILTMVRDLELAEIKHRASGPAYPDIDTIECKPHWITYDLTKAFDTVHPWLACRVLELCGYNSRFVRSYRHHLVHNVRRWKLPHRGLGEAWCSTTGIAQGCALSAMSAVAVYSIITRHIHEKVALAGGSVQVLSYIEDFSIGAEDPVSLEVARAAMQEIIDDFGMTINEKKTKVISVVPQLHEGRQCLCSLALCSHGMPVGLQ
eukprot:4437009-Amphidinium_carterae.3